MTAIDELYQELIVDHARSPRNFGVLGAPDRVADGHNPLCGDVIHLTLDLDEERVRDVRFSGEGCAISTASASVMTEAIRGKTVEEASALFGAFLALLTDAVAPDVPLELGKLEAFGGVKRFPARVKCAMLPWRTLESALGDDENPVTTE